MVKFRILLILSAGLFWVSCAKLQYLDSALALKAYSDEKDAQQCEVARRDALFERLLVLVKSGNAHAFLRSTADLEHQFGPPVLKKGIEGLAGQAEEWVYRHQIQATSSAKVYVIVSIEGKIKEFRYEEPVERY